MHFALAEVVHNQSFLYAVMCDFMIAVRHALHMKYFICLKMIYISYASTGVCAWLPQSPSLRPQRLMHKPRRLRGQEPLPPSSPERVVGSTAFVENPSTLYNMQVFLF